MSNDQPSRRPAGKAGGGAPMGSTVSIVIAVVAVVVGFLVLRNINDSEGDTTSAGSAPNTDVTGSSADIPGSETTVGVTVAPGPSTTAPLVIDPAQIVIVANASGLGGAAGRYTKALHEGAGFTTGTATDATTPKLDLSVVYFLPGGEAVADSVARAMGAPETGVLTAAMPAPPPITGATMPAGATVLVMLGTDRANLALPILAGTTATTLPGAPIDNTSTSLAP